MDIKSRRPLMDPTKPSAGHNSVVLSYDYDYEDYIRI